MSPQMPFTSVRFDITTPEGWENMRRWLVGHRKRMRLTQVAVAGRMGSTQDVVSKLERGVSDPQVSTVMRYIRALDLVPDINARDREAK